MCLGTRRHRRWAYYGFPLEYGHSPKKTCWICGVSYTVYNVCNHYSFVEVKLRFFLDFNCILTRKAPKKLVPSLKLTANAPGNRPGPERKLVFQLSVFTCYVSFREDNPLSMNYPHASWDWHIYPLQSPKWRCFSLVVLVESWRDAPGEAGGKFAKKDSWRVSLIWRVSCTWMSQEVSKWLVNGL